MYVVDTNVLIYAANSAAPQHRATNDWLTAALRGGETVGFPWVSLLGFIRIVTSPRVMPRPVAVSDALTAVDLWVSRPNAVLLEPGPRHLALLAGLLTASGTGGNLTTDAHIAALALDIRGCVVTHDRGFSRFGVEILVPGAAPVD